MEGHLRLSVSILGILDSMDLICWSSGRIIKSCGIFEAKVLIARWSLSDAKLELERILSYLSG